MISILVNENLVYNKYTGRVVCISSLGTVNDEQLQLERKCQVDSSHPHLAKLGLILILSDIYF